MPRVRLVPIPASDLPALVQGTVPASVSLSAAAGGLPPPHVAARVMQRLAAGKPAFWVGMFYVFADDGCCVGACGFKDVPRTREVEIGYGIAPSRRGRGYASAALAELLRMAAESREVDTVLLLIASDNSASEKVAQRAGFTRGDSALDEDGDLTVRWTLAV